MSNALVQQNIANTWESKSFTGLDTALFGTTPVVTPANSDCAVVPCGPFKPTIFNTTLPTEGTVDAIGVFVDGINANHRFDNFTIAANFANQGQCIADLIELNCAGITGRDRQACNKQQQTTCKEAFQGGD
jgi:hypothetical protein